MAQPQELDYLIIGQGLAGSCVAHELAGRGANFAVLDELRATAASRVAAGMINPMTFRRVIPSWKALDLLPVAYDFYQELGEKFGQSFLLNRPIYKVFGSDQERPVWEQQANAFPAVSITIDGVTRPGLDQVNAPHGGGLVAPAYWLNISAMLGAVRNWLADSGRLLECKLDYSAILPGSPVELLINGRIISVKRVIFAEGVAAQQNPWFGWLPFRPAKGDVLTIEATGLPEAITVKKNIFVMPIGNGRYRVGSTYNWQDQTDTPTAAGRQELEEKLQALIGVPYTVIDHTAGVRPTIADRRPFLGQHPQWESLWIFNGLGTRGGLQAPWLAKQLVAALEDGQELVPEISISRHVARHFRVAGEV